MITIRRLFSKISSLWKYSLLPVLIRFSIKIKLPFLTAMLLLTNVKRLNNFGTIRALCLSRSIFMDDIRANLTFSKKIRYFSINLSTFEMILRYFGKEPDCRNLTENNYHSSDYCVLGKQRYFSYLAKLIPHLKSLLRFDVVLSGNFNYASQQELARVCQENNIPFIVMYKEGLVYHEALTNYMKNYDGNKFIGTKLFSYSEKIAVALQEKEIPGLTKGKIGCLKGLPRFDLYFFDQRLKEQPEQRQLVFFSFFPASSFRYFGVTPEQLEQLEIRSAEFHYWVMKFAKDHPDIKVVIKTKRADYFVQYVRDILSKNFKEGIDNLTISNILDPATLIKDSFAVVGFSSTTLIESIILGKIIITPYFGDILPKDTAWDFFKDFPLMVNYAKTYENLEDYLSDPEKYSNYDSKIKDSFLNKYLSNSDGGASLRAEQAIIDTINKFSKN